MFRLKMGKLAVITGIDGAVFYSLLAKIWQSGAGLLTLLLVAHMLSPLEQGIYYTFNSVLALQVFFELGFSYILMQFASHEYAALSWTNNRMIQGDLVARCRVSSLIKLASKWYVCASLGLVVLVVPGGAYFFNMKQAELGSTNWLLPWILLVVFSAGSLMTTPYFSILEGLGQIKQVAAVRAFQEMLCGIILWISLYFGMGLFSACIYQGARFVFASSWLFIYYRHFIFDAFRLYYRTTSVNWATEIWPMQWKISLSWVGGYLVNQLFTPVVFSCQGAIMAGRLGMSLSLVSGLNSAALAWMTTKAPRFGMLVARKDYVSLDSLFSRTIKQCITVGLFGACLLLLGSVGLQYYNFPISHRLLAPADLCLLLIAILANLVMSAEAIYLRAHKQEPFLVLSLVNGVATALSVVVFGRFYGVTSMLIAYCTIMLIVGGGWGTVTFFKKRRLWHCDGAAALCSRAPA
jgi:O-antigen/teichoic acid export membrane protein